MNEIICLKCCSHDDYYETASGFDSCTNCRAPVFVGKKQEEKTLRDYFASHSPYGIDQAIDVIKGGRENRSKNDSASFDELSESLAQMNYHYADAMIKERNK